MRSSRRWLAAWIVPLLTIALSSCSDSEPEAASPLSLIWISLDTLRADHLGIHGYHRNTSPFLDSLAQRGLYFEWAIAPQNSTLPSHLTMFTGLHPIVHGIYHGRRRPGLRIAETVRTLPEALSDRGFATLARVDDAWMMGKFGFSQGFDTYHEIESPLEAKLEATLADLDRLESGRTFLYFLHTYEIHAPYEPPAAYAHRFEDAGSANDDAAADEAARARDRYDGSIRYVDDLLRHFVDELESRGLLSATVLAITSDHGESFAEYGIAEIGHAGNNLHQNITRVPWIVLHPDSRYRGKIEDLVGLIDFPNTMLAMLGLPDRLPGGGRNVLEPEASDSVYLSWTGAGAFSLYSENQHLLWSESLPGPERNALYRTDLDPLESRSMGSPRPDDPMMVELRETIQGLEAEEARIGESLRDRFDVPEKTLDRLRALGYLD